MKYLLLLVAACACSVCNYAQVNTPFISETFGSGTMSSLPTGWTAASLQGPAATWKWMHQKSSSANALDVIQSASANDGWMLLDVDSTGAANPAANLIESVLTSPPYDCSGHSSVILRFQQFFRKHYDSVSVEVSNGSGWTAFYPSSTTYLQSPGSTSNPDDVELNISRAAANHANVQVRFHYFDSYTAGGSAYGYSWMIDDLSLTEADSIDLKVSTAMVFGLNNAIANGYFPFTSIPQSLADTFVTGATFSNLGRTSNSSAKVIMSTTRNGIVTGTDTQSVSLPEYSADVSANLSAMTCNGTGNYIATYYVDTTGDGDKSNNIDTALSFTISDSLYSDLPKAYTKDFTVHAPGSMGSGEISFTIGTELYIPAGKSDTLTAISIAFSPATKPGITMSAFVTYWDGQSWNIFDQIGEKQLSASDITRNRNAPVFSRFSVSTPYPMVLPEGVYAIMLAAKNVAAADSVYILGGATNTPPEYLSNPVSPASIYDTSYNDGVPVAPSSGLYYAYYPYTTSLRAHFGKYVPLSIGNVNQPAFNVTIYPNPASDELHIRYYISSTADLNIQLLNALGSVVRSQTIDHVSSAPSEATVNTEGLPNGAYFYIIEAGGIKQTGNVTIVHQ